MKKPLRHILLTAIALAATPCFTQAGTTSDAKSKAPIEVEREDFPVHPISSPYWNEDATITTDLRPVFVYHSFPGEILGGGRATVSALQIRVRLLKNLQLVAYKDGWVDINTPGLKDHGWNDLGAGLKWAFYQNDPLQLHAAIGAGYEFASGDDHVLQDDDEVRCWFSIDKGFGKLHLGAVVNYLKSLDNGDSILGDSDLFTWHLHADYQVNKYFSPVVEVNGFHTTKNDAGHTNTTTPFSGVDIANLGGNIHANVITAAIGAEFRPVSRVALRAAYEFPLTDELDVYGHRWTFSAVFTF